MNLTVYVNYIPIKFSEKKNRARPGLNLETWDEVYDFQFLLSLQVATKPCNCPLRRLMELALYSPARCPALKVFLLWGYCLYQGFQPGWLQNHHLGSLKIKNIVSVSPLLSHLRPVLQTDIENSVQNLGPAGALRISDMRITG